MERVEVIVPDASIVVKWFIQEEYYREADRLRLDYVNQVIDIAVPNIIYYEVLNALRYSGIYGEDEINEIGEVLHAYQFLDIPLKGEYLRESVRTALKYGVTIYDASYIAIAHIMRAILYTADEKLISKVNNPSLIKHIRDYRVERPNQTGYQTT
ncbi:MAG TPA: PIN domain-containing protein [Thermoprotei archaeon]|nr:PIN domain-containing protein [Thermoprotei archaeon]